MSQTCPNHGSEILERNPKPDLISQACIETKNTTSVRYVPRRVGGFSFKEDSSRPALLAKEITMFSMSFSVEKIGPKPPLFAQVGQLSRKLGEFTVTHFTLPETAATRSVFR